MKSINRKDINEFIKFLIVGTSAFLIDFSINTFLVYIMHFDKSLESGIANVASFLIALAYNYNMSSRWTFKDRKTDHTFFRFVGVNIFNLVWSSLLLMVIVKYVLGLGLIDENFVQPLSKIFITCISIVVSFVLYRTFVFKK